MTNAFALPGQSARSPAPLVVLSLLVALGALVAGGAGLFWHGPGEPFTMTNVYGDAVEIYGRGVYRHDSLFKAPILRGTDAVTVFLGIPVLLATLRWYRHDRLRGGLLLSGVLSYFLYNSASLALGAAYNPLLLAYIAYFTASLAAFVVAAASVDARAVAQRLSPRAPRRLIAAFLFLAGASVFVWLIEIVGSLTRSEPPRHLGPYHTEPTYLLDLGIIAPAAFLGGTWLLRRRAAGYCVAAVLLVLNAFVGPMVVSQSIFQLRAGVGLTLSEIAIFAGTFVATSSIAALLAVALFRSIRVRD